MIARLLPGAAREAAGAPAPRCRRQTPRHSRGRGAGRRSRGVTRPRLPGINHEHAVRALEKVGFRMVRRGKPLVMSDGVRILTILRYNPVNAITMGGIVLG